jgi:hypothetical protein
MIVQDEKFIVFRREDFYQMMGAYLPGGGVDCAPVAQDMQERAEQACLKDAVVIRRQDVFAPPALDAYHNSINAAVEVLERTKEQLLDQLRPDTLAVDLLDAEITGLRKIADYFHAQAEAAWDTDRRLPD